MKITLISYTAHNSCLVERKWKKASYNIFILMLNSTKDHKKHVKLTFLFHIKSCEHQWLSSKKPQFQWS